MIKYTNKWFKSVSDEELDTEREPVRIKAVYDGDERAWDLMTRFDQEMARRANEKYNAEHPNATPRHREHGWYLDNDE